MVLVITILSFFLCLSLPFRIPSRRKLNLVLVGHVIAFIKTGLLFNSVRNDSWQYFHNTRGLSFDFGTGSIVALTQLLRDIVDDYFAISMIFSITAIVSVLILAQLFYANTQRPKAWETLLFYLVVVAGVVFWGAGIGKDGIVLLGVTIFSSAVLRLPRIKVLPFVVALLLITPIRPHISLLLVSGLAIGVALSREVPLLTRFALVIVGTMAFVGGLPYVLSYTGIQGGVASAANFLEDLGTRFEGSGSYVDISSLPAPARMLSFFLRPLLIEASNISQIIAALQNIGIAIYLWLLLRGLHKHGLTRRGVYPVLLAMSLTVGFVLSYTASNLGLATRQKWMSLIPLIFAYLSFRAQVGVSKGTRTSRTL